jgi:DNA-directed RNA polymerase specialized sigma24 family protein
MRGFAKCGIPMEEQACYKEGMSISRNFEHREEKETRKLYDIIKRAIVLIQEGSPYEREKATYFLTELFEPYIRKISNKLYRNLHGAQDYADILQETYTMFLTLLNKYNPKVSAFSYYIGIMLPQHMNRWAEKEIVYTSVNTPIDIEEYSLVDPSFKNANVVSDYLNAYVLTREYQEFIKKRAERQSRSGTVSQVCYRYFLGSDTCSEIARDLGISYHAVYEIIGKIKKELQQFFYKSAFSGCVVSSTGIVQKDVTYGQY